MSTFNLVTKKITAAGGSRVAQAIETEIPDGKIPMGDAGAPGGVTMVDAPSGGGSAILHSAVTQVGTLADTTEDDLMSYSMPGGTLVNAGDCVLVEASGVAFSSAGTIRFYFGASAPLEIYISSGVANYWNARFLVTMKAAGQQNVSGVMVGGDASVFAEALQSTSYATGEDETGAIDIKFTGTNDSATLNGIRQHKLIVYQLNAAGGGGAVAAADVTNTPAGNIAATDVQAALNELDNEKVPTARTVSTTAPLTGGGDLSADRTLAISDFVASGASHANGAVPDPGAVAGSTKFLCEDGTWSVPAGSGGSAGMGQPSGTLDRSYTFDTTTESWTNSAGTITSSGGQLHCVEGSSADAICLEPGTAANVADGELVLDYTLSSGNAAGIVFRVTDADNLYLIQFNPTTTYYLYKKVAGAYTSLNVGTMPSCNLQAGIPYRLMVRFVGNTISLWVNETWVHSWTDATYSTGLCGVRVFLSTIDVDNVKVYQI